VVILASTHGRGDDSDFTFKVMEAIEKMKFKSIIIINKRKDSSNVTYSNTISLKYHNVRHKIEYIWHIELKEHPI
jgi:MinD superfamily P-loop ATPase